MITIYLIGGLGNQLFQLAFLMSYALDNKKPFQLAYTETLTVGITRPTYWNSFLSSLRPFTRPVEQVYSNNLVQIHEPHYRYMAPPPGRDNVMFVGYFQSPSYFHHRASDLFKLLRLEQSLTRIHQRFPEIGGPRSVSMHFRWGDYKNLSGMHPVMPLAYYQNSLRHLLHVDPSITTIYLFGEPSDRTEITSTIVDPLKQEFPILQFEWVASPNIEDWEEMLLMSQCQHHIIANSSFSWWGAYIGHCIGGQTHRVCYPTVWFGPELCQKNDVSDLFMKSWIPISVTSSD